MTRADPAQTRAWVRDLVRSGLLDDGQLRAEVADAVCDDHPGLPQDTAERWIAEAYDDWRREATTWSEPTDHTLLERVFADLADAGFLVLRGCPDHWAAAAALQRSTGSAGAVWFTPPDVWHAIDEAMLEVNLWHPDTANAAPGDPLLEQVLGVFERHGFAAHFDEGRIEVTARWRRRPPD